MVAAPKLNPASPLNDGLLAWYLAHPAYFDGMVWPDLSGNGHDGDLLRLGRGNGTVEPWSSGWSVSDNPLESAVAFPGTNTWERCQVDSVGEVLRATPTTNTVTISAWVKRQTENSIDFIFDVGTYAPSNLGLLFTNSPVGGLESVYGGSQFTTEEGVVPLATWCFVSATVDATTGERVLFVDGVEVGRSTIAVPPTFTIGSDTAVIGVQSKTMQQSGRGFAGLISDVRIYSRVLDPSEIAAYYAESLGGYKSVLLSAGSVLSSPRLANHFDPSQLLSSPHLLGSFP